MSEGSSSTSPEQRRTLAAIVFTDIVNFSAQMQGDEDRTLRLARRDLDYIRKVCDECEGKVLKNTGDGLLMYFSSAVQAVACAMKAQKAMASLKNKLPAEEVLQHRIGIHLGDVFVGDGDVMGDGVNIAARLQAEAEPGGVCVSQTVYDVVKNRLGVKATYLGPRELKNIQEAVPVYQILLDAAAVAGGGALSGRAGWLRKWWPAVAGAAAAAAGVVALVLVLGGAEQSGSGGGAGVREVSADSPQAAPPPPVEAPARVERVLRAGPNDLPAPSDPGDPQYDTVVRRGIVNQDYVAVAEYLRRTSGAGDPRVARWEEVAGLRKLARIRLMTASPDDPLVIRIQGHSGAMLEGRIWLGADRQFRLLLPGQDRARVFRRLPPRFVAKVYEAVARSPRQQRASRFLNEQAERLGLLEHRPSGPSGGPGDGTSPADPVGEN